MRGRHDRLTIDRQPHARTPSCALPNVGRCVYTLPIARRRAPHDRGDRWIDVSAPHDRDRRQLDAWLAVNVANADKAVGDGGVPWAVSEAAARRRRDGGWVAGVHG
jgi:hypothetical protein